MKKLSFLVAIAFGCALQLWAQEPSVSIRIDDEERFRFDSIRMSFTNPHYHVMIGDSTGMDPEGIYQTSFSTFIGHKAGRFLKSGDYNTFIGAQAGEDHKHGQYNLYVGGWAGRYDSAGRLNTFIGTDVGVYNKTGQKNTYVGYASGAYCDSGYFNTFIGYWSGAGTKGGQHNVFLGSDAGRYSGRYGTAFHNTYIGANAGRNNENGNDNVFIGFGAGMNETLSNRLHIANHETESLIYGEFDNKMLRLNAGRMEIRNPLENTIIGDSSGAWNFGARNTFLGYKAGYTNTAGYDNIFVGDSAGYSNSGGWGNVFFGNWAGYLNTTGRYNLFAGTGAGISNTSGILNVILGTTSGYANTTGNENVFVGTSAGGGNITGSRNTYLGRGTAWNNTEGSGNVFIGYRAGTNEYGSDKLYIANSAVEPLIYGDFAEKYVIFNTAWIQVNGGSLHASNEITTDRYFVATGNPGITDTVNTITNYDFAQQKLKYRTTVYTGGIVTFLSLESGWVDAVGEYLTPCGEISMVGEFNGWANDFPMRRNAYDPDLWSATFKITIDDDHSEPVDSIIETKFRENAGWEMSWGSEDFPTGTGTNQYGLNIPVTLSATDDTTLYFVMFNCRTGAYTFEDLTGFCGDSITDARDEKKYATVLIGNQCWMAQDLNVGLRINASGDQSDDSIIEKYCYDDLESNCTLWGGLYQWPELMNYVTTPGVRGICPMGWHVPTDGEFKVLEGNVDSQYGPGSVEWHKFGTWRGLDAGYHLRASSGWSNGNGSDAFGFHALPGGYMIDYNVFNDGGGCLNYQTSSSDSYGNPFVRHINGDFSEVLRNVNPADDGCSLRCIKDN